MNLSGFKAYDVRGRYPATLNEELARNIGYAFAREFGAKRVVIGHDARLSGPALYGALAEGLRAAGADVTGIGLCGTEEIYFASFAEDFDGSIMFYQFPFVWTTGRGNGQSFVAAFIFL